MISFMTIIYVALVVLVFKVFKVRPRPWPIGLTVTGGILLIGTILVLWTIAAPISKRAVVARYVVQIVPWVKGRVTGIGAEPNVPLTKGDVLYQIDPTPFQYDVDQATAQLQAAKSNVTQLDAALQVARAGVEKAVASVQLSKTQYDVAEDIAKTNPAAIATVKLEEAKDNYAMAQATLEQAKAGVDQAAKAVTAAQDNVGVFEAQLQTAKFNLQQCTVTAPADGFVTEWQIRPGTFVVPLSMAAAGTFIDTTDTYIVASYPAEQLIHVRPGQVAELAFKSCPGRLFRGTVDTVIQASGEGQFMTSGHLTSAAAIGSPGYLAVKIRFDDDKVAEQLAMGTPAAVAIYTDWGKPFAVISKVGIRIQKWLYFLPL